MTFNIATNEGIENRRTFGSGKLAFNPVVSGCLPHSLAPPFNLRSSDFWFWFEGKIVHKKVPFSTVRSGSPTCKRI
jgi:hypothetical protein